MLARVEHLSFVYRREEGTPDTDQVPFLALDGVDLTLEEGEYVAVVGANGSGKTTLIKHLNALLLPSAGDVWVSGWNTKDPSRLLEIRRTMGMVFQDPSAQVIQSTVEEEVAFGPENLGVDPREMRFRVDAALAATGLGSLSERPCGQLSSGQKQLLAMAAALSMEPRCLLLDEASAMLDFRSKALVVETVEGLNRRGITIVSVTQDMDEAARAGRVIVLSAGKIVMDGPPREVLSRIDRIRELRLDPPSAVDLAEKIRKSVARFPEGLFTVRELVSEIARRAKRDARLERTKRDTWRERAKGGSHRRGGKKPAKVRGPDAAK